MAHTIPMDVYRYILSFTPIRDPKYDCCMDQIKYFDTILSKEKNHSSIHHRTYYRTIPFYIYILKKSKFRGYVNLKLFKSKT